MSDVVPHLVLLGDSVFDNGSYVGYGNPSVIQQLQSKSEQRGWKSSSVAIDGNILSDIPKQLSRLPADATHLFISIGGNNALYYMYFLEDPANTIAEGLVALHDIKEKFEKDFVLMLRQVKSRRIPFTLCTIYNPRFADCRKQIVCQTGLTILNDVILTESFKLGVPVIDLKTIFNKPEDYANSIEPASIGGAKIVENILQVIDSHRFDRPITSVYAQLD